jgi:hypothetical protein
LEAKRLGHGRIYYLSEVLGCDRKTVRKGIDEILDPPDLDPARVRQKGGRKSGLDNMPELRDNFQEVLRRYTAGDPMQEDIKWTDLTKTEVVHRLAQTSTPVSVNMVRQLLDAADFHRRKLRKMLSGMSGICIWD